MVNDVTVYGKDNCPQCDIAKKKLDNSNTKYTYINLSKPENSNYIDEFKLKGFKSVPIIINDDKVVDLISLLK